MTIRADMLNGHKTCHGGIIFTLADSAFAFACNTDNIATVAQGAQINFLKPAFEGDILTAAATVTHQGGRTGLCDVTLTNQNGQKIAFFRGNSYRLKSESVKGLNIKKPI
jgi:acyl-CoA thioesterase